MLFQTLQFQSIRRTHQKLWSASRASIGWRWHEVGMWCQQKIVFDYTWIVAKLLTKRTSARRTWLFVIIYNCITYRFQQQHHPGSLIWWWKWHLQNDTNQVFHCWCPKNIPEKFPDNSIEHYLFVILTWSYLCARWNIWLFRCGIFIWIVLGSGKTTVYDVWTRFPQWIRYQSNWWLISFSFRVQNFCCIELNCVCVCVYDSVVVWSYCIIISSLWQWHRGNHARFQLLRNRIVVQFLPRIDLCCAISFAIRFYYNQVTLGAESIIFRFHFAQWLLLSLRRSCLLAARRQRGEEKRVRGTRYFYSLRYRANKLNVVFET